MPVHALAAAARGPLTEALFEALRQPPDTLPRACPLPPASAPDAARRRGPPARALPLLRAALPRPAGRRRRAGSGSPTLLRAARASSRTASRRRCSTRSAAPAEAAGARARWTSRCARSPTPTTARRCRATSSARRRVEQLREFVVHRSAYQLKEADPHSWALPRLHGGAEGRARRDPGRRVRRRPRRARSTRRCSPTAMDALGLDSDATAPTSTAIPGVTLATVNLMSLLRAAPALARRDRRPPRPVRDDVVDPEPALRRRAAPARASASAATDFFDEHVEADAVHENIAAVDLAGGLARQEPALAPTSSGARAPSSRSTPAGLPRCSMPGAATTAPCAPRRLSTGR